MMDTRSDKNSILLVILIIILAGAIGVFIYQRFFIEHFNEIQEMRGRISLLQQEIKKLKKQNEMLTVMIKALKNNDPGAWEIATRKHLDWVKPGEIIIEEKDK